MDNNIWFKLMDFGSRLGCHQIPERSLFIKGYQLPICARCTGFILGQLIWLILYIFHIHFKIIFSFIAFFTMIIDGELQYIGFFKSTNLRRIITGTLGGFAYLNIVIFAIKNLLKLFLK